MAVLTKKREQAEDTAVRRERRSPGVEAFVPGLPTVNLLPASVLQKAALARLRRKFAIAAGAVVLLLAAAWALQAAMIASAESELAVEQDRASALATELNALTPVKTYYGQIQANQETIQQTMAKEVLFSDVVDALMETTPQGVQLGQIAFKVDAGGPPTGTPDAAAEASTAAFASCPSPDPFGDTVVVGCVTVTGTATSRAVIGQLITAFEDHPKFHQVFVSTTTAGGEGGITFSATIGLSDEIYADRYADPDFLAGARR